jgi:hypothetical protein
MKWKERAGVDSLFGNNGKNSPLYEMQTVYYKNYMS